jgi:2-polyprenyl-3-methyl-5-hydroxy-6-metoxy-1,4-benzoquinol methylase
MRKIKNLFAVTLITMFASAFAFAQDMPSRPLDVPYVPTSQKVVDAMLSLAKVTKNDVVYDLGCGDGRIVITAAQKYGATGTGIDIDPVRIREANENAKKAGVTNKVNFKVQDLFESNFSKATVVTLYLLPDINLRLRPQLLEQLKPGTRIVSHAFSMGDWKPDQTITVDGSVIYLWTVPAKKPTFGDDKLTKPMALSADEDTN